MSGWTTNKPRLKIAITIGVHDPDEERKFLLAAPRKGKEMRRGTLCHPNQKPIHSHNDTDLTLLPDHVVPWETWSEWRKGNGTFGGHTWEGVRGWDTASVPVSDHERDKSTTWSARLLIRPLTIDLGWVRYIWSLIAKIRWKGRENYILKHTVPSSSSLLLSGRRGNSLSLPLLNDWFQFVMQTDTRTIRAPVQPIHFSLLSLIPLVADPCIIIIPPFRLHS